MEAQWSPQQSLNGRYWSDKEDRMVQGRQKHRWNWCTMFTTVRIFYGVTNGRPLCIHSATTTMLVPSSSLLGATCERPTYSGIFVRLFWTWSKLHGDHCVHGDVCTSSVPPLNDQGKSSAFYCFQWRPGQFCGHTRKAQRSQSCVKEVLGINDNQFSYFPMH